MSRTEYRVVYTGAAAFERVLNRYSEQGFKVVTETFKLLESDRGVAWMWLFAIMEKQVDEGGDLRAEKKEREKRGRRRTHELSTKNV